jgi:hypothetical protein
VTHRQVIDPPAWCGVVTTFLCGGCGDPIPSEKLFSGDGIEVTGDLVRASVGKPWWRVKKSPGRDSVTGKK